MRAIARPACCSIGNIARHRGQRSDRSGDDNVAPIAHQRQRALDREKGTAQVDVMDLVPELFGHLIDGGETAHARIDEQDVDPAQRFLDFRHGARALLRVGNVAADGQGVQILGNFAQGIRVTTGDRNLGAFFTKSARGGKANARRPAQHDHAAVNKLSGNRNHGSAP
jgi:hypothetical protein